MNTIELMFSLIRLAIFDEPLTKDEAESISLDMIKTIYDISNQHDISHIIAVALMKCNKQVDFEHFKMFKDKQMKAIYRYTKLSYEQNRIFEALEEAEIPFIPLKGAVIRKYYPEEWMRTSCDIDVLVHKEDLGRAVEQLKERLNYSSEGNLEYHDISLYSSTEIHLELHFNIKENIANLDRVLETIWDYATPVELNGYMYEVTNEFLLFHQVAHATYHFLSGGCGVRPVMDLWLLKRGLKYYEDILNGLLEEANILEFSRKFDLLSAVWMNGEKHEKITLDMENYILSGGVYGSFKNKIEVRELKTGGKFKYALARIILPYKDLIRIYPSLENRKWLLPFYEVLRWFRVIFKGRFKRSVEELSYNAMASKDQTEKNKEFLKEIGLL